jgi:hypothetical protein
MDYNFKWRSKEVLPHLQKVERVSHLDISGKSIPKDGDMMYKIYG